MGAVKSFRAGNIPFWQRSGTKILKILFYHGVMLWGFVGHKTNRTKKRYSTSSTIEI